MNEIALISRAALMLAEARTFTQLEKVRDLALAARAYAKAAKLGQQAINHATSIKLQAERRMGIMLKDNPRKGGGRPNKNGGNNTPFPTLEELGTNKEASRQLRFLADLSDAKFNEIESGGKTVSQVKREIKLKEIKDRLNDIETRKLKKIEGAYDVLVIDPPWPVKKIERDIAPTQVEDLDYPIMTLEEIENLKISPSDDCHIWLWTTHKYLPVAFRILEKWGLLYVCTFVWHKNGGFQPFDLPQYNCEFALYARKGSPKFIDTKNFPTCFSANRTRHSEKPEEFYDMVRRITAGRRLDMFNRRKIKGFNTWGLEAKS